MACGGRAHAAARTRDSSGVQRTSPPHKRTGAPANAGPGTHAASPRPAGVFPAGVARRGEGRGGGGGTGAGGLWALVLVTPELPVGAHAPAGLRRLSPAESRSCPVRGGLSPPVRLALPGTTAT